MVSFVTLLTCAVYYTYFKVILSERTPSFLLQLIMDPGCERKHKVNFEHGFTMSTLGTKKPFIPQYSNPNVGGGAAQVQLLRTPHPWTFTACQTRLVNCKYKYYSKQSGFYSKNC